MSTDLKIEDGKVVSMNYTLHVNGEVVDSSSGREPLEFIQGTGNIIPGLERELYGMMVGESKKVSVVPVDGYGELDPKAFADVPRTEFPDTIPMEKGVQVQVQSKSGKPMYARIDEFSDAVVKLDFNHPLAGKTLDFDVTIVALRGASPAELDHGHVHDGAEHH